MRMIDPVSRFTGLAFQLDTNRINSRGRLQYINQLEAWDKDGVIELAVCEVVRAEIERERDPLRLRKVYRYFATETLAHTLEEYRLWYRIASALCPRGIASENQRNDVTIVFNAKKYGYKLVTADGASRTQRGGILGHAAELHALDVEVMTDAEAVALCEKKIATRDSRVHWRLREFGMPLPEWVGRD